MKQVSSLNLPFADKEPEKQKDSDLLSGLHSLAQFLTSTWIFFWDNFPSVCDTSKYPASSTTLAPATRKLLFNVIIHLCVDLTDSMKTPFISLVCLSSLLTVSS
jgi:hypothetical protein